MKLSASPLQNKALNQPAVALKNRIHKQLQKPYRPIVDLFARNQQEEQKKNANSIKKVLKELTDLKKEIKEIKNAGRQQKMPQTLDMSQCRKNNEQLKRSPDSRENYSKSHSSSKNKSNSQPRRETSTQTLQKYRQVNDFSFSIDSKAEKKPKKAQKVQSDQQDSNNSVQQTSAKKSAVATKRLLHKSLISPRKVDVEEAISSKVATIQANQLYENNLNLLKLSSQTFQVSSPFFTPEDKLKLNIQVQRLAKSLTRIPIYFKSPEQYYEALQLYARSLNNQLNNFVLVLNRVHSSERLNEKTTNSPSKQGTFGCNKCEQNEKKGVEKTYRKQMKRYQKQIERLSNDITSKDTLIRQFKQSHQNLVRQIAESRQIWKTQKKYSSQLAQKCETMSAKLIKFEKQKQKAEKQLQERTYKIIQLQQDVKYYKKELQKMKDLSQTVHLSEKKALSCSSLQARINQLQNLIKELKDKERLYQVIIQEKENIIRQLQMATELKPEKYDAKRHTNLIRQQDQQSIDSADYYKLKMNNEQLLNKIHAQNSQIYKLKQQNERLHLKISNNSSQLELCLAEIDKLHVEIGLLEEANQKYKDKCLKSRIVNQKKTRKESQSQVKKGQAFQQINELIKQHRQGIVKQK